jgi:hypothetical protein
MKRLVPVTFMLGQLKLILLVLLRRIIVIILFFFVEAALFPTVPLV